MTKNETIFSKAPDMKYHEEIQQTDVGEFEKVVKNRRSVRLFTADPVPKAVIENALDWALLAPNSSNLQCFELLWIQNTEAKNQLKKFCFGQPAAKSAPELIVVVAKPYLWKKHAKQMLHVFQEQESKGVEVPKSAKDYYGKLAPMVYRQGPLGILGLVKKIAFFFVGLKKIVPREPTSHGEMRIWANKSAALACQNFMMGLSAQGFDSCPMEGFDSKRVKKLLKLSRCDDIVMVISCGKRSPGGVYGPRLRFPKEQFIKII
jgi:nitroreductase